MSRSRQIYLSWTTVLLLVSIAAAEGGWEEAPGRPEGRPLGEGRLSSRGCRTWANGQLTSNILRHLLAGQ